MIITPTRGTRAGGTTQAAVALIVALMLVLLLPAPADAQDRNYSYGDHVDLAGAVWITERENSFSDLTIRVYHLRERSTWSGPVNYKDPGIIMFYTKTETDPSTGAVTETNYEAFSGSPDNRLTFRRSLDGASADFTLRVWGYRCVYEAGDPNGGPQGISAASACEDLPETLMQGEIEWTGTGTVTRAAIRSRDSAPPSYMFGTHTVSATRAASAEGSIAGEGLTLADGPATFGILLRGKYAEHYVGAGRPQSR